MTERAGFSLVETVVALAVFGLAALAVVNLTTESARSAARVQTRLLAGVVADNLAAEALAAPDAPAPGSREGVGRMAGRDWPWRRRVEGVAGGLLKIEVVVFDGAAAGAESGAAATVTAWRAAP